MDPLLARPLPEYPDDAWEVTPEELKVMKEAGPIQVGGRDPPYGYHDTFVEVLEDINPPADEENNGDKRLMLQLEAGETIKVWERWTGDKWMGLRCKDNSIGFFKLDERVRPILSNQVRAIWDYLPDNETDLKFWYDTVIDVIDKEGSWWFWGSYEDHIGLFPYNYVESLPPKPEDRAANIVEDSTPEIVYARWDYAPTTPRELACRAGDAITVLKKWRHDWWYVKIGARKGLFPVNYLRGEGFHYPSRALERPSFPLYFVRALYDWEAGDQVELKMEEGDLVEVSTVCNDQWWQGQSNTGEAGWFPANYVEPILDRRMYEDERDEL